MFINFWRSAGLAIVFSLLCLSTALAQSQPTDCPPGEVFDNDAGGCIPTPLDGGVLFLLAAGAAYGAKKIRDNRQDSAEIG